MVPAPTSVSYGCCNTQPCFAQKLERLRMISWYVGTLAFGMIEYPNLSEVGGAYSAGWAKLVGVAVYAGPSRRGSAFAKKAGVFRPGDRRHGAGFSLLPGPAR